MKHARIDELNVKHKCTHPDYEHYRKDFVQWGYANQCLVSL